MDYSYKGYKVNYSLLASFIWSVVFFTLGFYLEQVMPRDFGLYEHPLFLCKSKKKMSKKEIKEIVSKLEVKKDDNREQVSEVLQQ
jgi:hypothetical protein